MKNFFIITLAVFVTGFSNLVNAQEIDDVDTEIYSSKKIEFQVELEDLEENEDYHLFAIDEDSEDTIVSLHFEADDDNMEITLLTDCDEEFFDYDEEYEIEFFLMQGSTLYDDYGSFEIEIESIENYVFDGPNEVFIDYNFSLEELEVSMDFENYFNSDIEIEVQVEIFHEDGSLIDEDDFDINIPEGDNESEDLTLDLDEFQANEGYYVVVTFESDDICLYGEYTQEFETEFQEEVIGLDSIASVFMSCATSAYELHLEDELIGAKAIVYHNGDYSYHLNLNYSSFVVMLDSPGDWTVEILQYSEDEGWEESGSYEFEFYPESLYGNLSYSVSGQNISLGVEYTMSYCDEGNARVELSKNGSLVSTHLITSLNEGENILDSTEISNLEPGLYKLKLIIETGNGDVFETFEYVWIESNLSTTEESKDLSLLSDNGQIRSIFWLEGDLLELFDLQGRLIKKSNSQATNVSELTEGVYFYRYTQNNKTFTGKIPINAQ